MEVDGCQLPEDRFYDLDADVWLQPEAGGGSAKIGVTHLLASFAGRFQSVTFRPVEGSLSRGRSVATVESLRFTGAVRLPVDATVVDRNDALRERPRLLNDAPYEGGWVVRIALADPSAVGRTLERAEAVRERYAEKVRALKVHCWPTVPEVELYEVGTECSAVLARLSEEIARRAPGEAVLIVSDDPTSPIELVRWSDRTGHPILAQRREENLYRFLVRRAATPTPRGR